MSLNKYQCPNCQKSELCNQSTLWSCQHCGKKYPCVNGIPRLYLEDSLGEKDRELRDSFYNGFLGTYYQHVMPFLSLPARPARTYWKGWFVYVLLVLFLFTIIGSLIILTIDHRSGSLPHVILILIIVGIGLFFIRHRYLFYLLLLAVPVKLSLLRKKFRPARSFQEVHAELIKTFSNKSDKLDLLDISTGTCNSLYRHGWMTLNATYTGLDLSETMLLQGQKLMAERQVPIELVLGDATRLPFANQTFDVVLNYGALNGYTEPKVALEEMARVTKKGGLVLFLDEQLYPEASIVERFYFKKVLSSHNVIHRCPVELIPPSLTNIALDQVYQFYYICTCYKS